MLSLNVPVPGEVKHLAADLRPSLVAFDRVRERHTLVCKRLDDGIEGGRPRIEGRVRRSLAGIPSFDARVTGIDYFDEPLAGPGPVLYLAVESPGLMDVHHRLVEEFNAVPGFEGEGYVPHVTLARGGDRATARQLAEQDIDPMTWTVNEFVLWDARYEEQIGTISLPA